MTKMYSIDGEQYRFSSFGELIDWMDEPLVGDVYYSADWETLTGADLISEWVVTQIMESMNDNFYEFISDDLDEIEVSDEAKSELDALLKAWANKYIDVSNHFKIVCGSEVELKLVAEDLE